MPDIISIILLISFLCFISGIFTPETVIRFGEIIPKTRQNVFKIYGLSTVVLYFIYLVSISPESISNTIVHSNQKEETTQIEVPMAQSVTAKVGEIAIIDNLQVQVNTVSKLQGDKINKPKPGYEYLLIEVSLKNTGQEKVSYNQFQFNITNDKDNILGPIFSTLDKDTALDLGDLLPNEAVSGTIVFEQPVDVTNVSLIYSPSSILSKEHGVFDLEQSVQTFERLESDLVNELSEEQSGIGDMISVGNVILQVQQINTIESKENSNKNWIEVSVTLKNTGQNTLAYYPFNFKMKNGSGQISTPLMSLPTQRGQLGMGEIISGGVASGTLVFEQSKTEDTFILLFEETSLFSSEQVIINLVPSENEITNLLPDPNLLGDMEIIKVGDIGQVNKIELKVHDVLEDLETIYHQPKPGYAYLVIELSLMNLNATSINYSIFDFKLMNELGQLMPPIVPILDDDIEIKSGKLSQDESVRGILVFEYPIDQEEFKLMYTP
ncbi:MAG: DUF4352 domain-containing protein, partial [Turicibacter sp.]